tara:strand:+ start:703 stop:1104 length:402 start_codon:yes stop_codon:yes gene_type:complete
VAKIAISYTPSGGSPVYSFELDNFQDAGFPRTYMGSASFDKSASGAVILSGPAYKEKYQWVISTYMPTSDAYNFDAMFRAWDEDRASGKSVACGIVDETWGPTVTTSAVFLTPPVFAFAGGNITLVSFGLGEI